jgi:hypothetical protein
MRLVPILAYTVVLVLGGFCSNSAVAQSFEGTAALELLGGVSIPEGTAGDTWGSGPVGRLSLRFPATPEISLGLEGGVVAPNSNSQYLDFLQVPIRLLFYVPLAGEAASTPYFAFGPGATVNIFSSSIPTEMLLEGESNETNTETHFSYALKVGYLLRPESMTNTFFDLGARYEQQIITDADDWRNIDLEVGVGLAF